MGGSSCEVFGEGTVESEQLEVGLPGSETQQDRAGCSSAKKSSSKETIINRAFTSNLNRDEIILYLCCAPQ